MAQAPASTTEELLQSLQEGVAQLTTTQEWTRWLDMQRRFHKYSLNNCLLIAMQCPEAKWVAGFGTWKSLGRSVRKGEKSIRILAPVTRTPEVLGDDGDLQRIRSVVNFKPVSVFDVSQTDGEELPAPPVARLDGDAPEAAWDQLAAIATTVAYSVALTPYLPGERNGDCTPQTKLIRVRETLSPAQRVKTLAHELAHALLHEDGGVDRPVAELEAESVAFIVCGSAFGLDTSSYSLGYVATWAGGGREALDALRESAERIAAAARRILDALGSDAEVGEEAA